MRGERQIWKRCQYRVSSARAAWSAPSNDNMAAWRLSRRVALFLSGASTHGAASIGRPDNCAS
jgi:hypothetical protein